ncbi:hypothetical protein B0T10DRAFT_497633 [Thelonectria olida]|uniref:C2H2-type domain-containing protein n=1 Tax=Thelonectria olida TaxID=1576542 RepID=A0A9P9AGK2_9HYPO|nr:hypothetical protein B0T10DRAFT_497633 [Thelonectria olida]
MGDSNHVGRARRASQCSQPELSQGNAPLLQSSSLRERLKDKGRHLLNRLKAPSTPGLFRPRARDLPFRRWMSDPLKQTMAGFLGQTVSRPTTEYAYPYDAVESTPSNDSPPEFPATNVVQGLVERHQSSPEPEPKHTWIVGSHSASSSILSVDAENHTGNTQDHHQWPDRLNGCATLMKSVATWDPEDSLTLEETSLPELGGDLTGVGSQYDVTRKPASQLLVATNGSDKLGPTNTVGDIHSQEPDADGDKPNTLQSSNYPPTPKRWSTGSAPQVAWDDLLTDNSSDLTLPRRDSIFSSNTRPSSIISSTTSIFDIISSGNSTKESSIGWPYPQYTPRESFGRKVPSSPPSLNISRGSPSRRRSQDMKELALPATPDLDQGTRRYTRRTYPPANMSVQQQSTQSQIVASATAPYSFTPWLIPEDHSMSDGVTLAGCITQQHRLNKTAGSLPVEAKGKELSSHVGIESDKENSKTAGRAALSTIHERHSDAGCSNTAANSMHHRSSSDHIDNGHLSPSPHSNRDVETFPVTETITDLGSPYSMDPVDESQTPTTSVTGQLASEALDQSEMSDADESMSDASDETDESLHEAFAASSLGPVLIAVAITLKYQITSLVIARVLAWMRSCPSGHDDSGGSQDTGFGFWSGDSSTGRGGGGKKRGFDRGNYGFDGGDGDDQGKRRKTETTVPDPNTSRLLPVLACPFSKGHPEKKWPKCQKGWPTVHRVKGHIYRNHKLPIHCERCFAKFETEEERKEHGRSDIPCKVLRPPPEMLGVDAATNEKLKSRRGIQNATEEKRWERMYKILFPNVQDIPSPYVDIQTIGDGMTPEIRSQYHFLLQRELPDRIISQVNSHVRNAPEYQHHAGFQRSLSTIIHRAVWDAFEDILPTSLPRREQLETPSDTISEVLPSMQHRQMPATSYSLQPAEPANALMVEDLSQDSPISTTTRGQEQILSSTSTSDVFAALENSSTQWLQHPNPAHELHAQMDTLEDESMGHGLEPSVDPLSVFNFDFGHVNFSVK